MDIASLLGGIGLFLLGMSMMTEGLNIAAGPALKSILGSWTRSARRGLLAGMLITAIVQSSSATIVAVIGFVNAGLLSLTQAIWVVFGANVGTTTIGWIVALIGVRFSMTAFGLPAVGVGMLINLFFRDSARAAGFGRAIAGFGAFFIGIGLLQDAFAATEFNVANLGIDESRISGLLALVLAGIILTFTTQSSSAAIAITLTAVASGALALLPAAAVVIGANIGTTSTALLATMGGTAAARRTALSHVAFSVIAGAGAFVLLPLFVWGSGSGLALLGVSVDDTIKLAAFHTLLNLLGVLLIWPLAPALIRFLSRRFVSDDEAIARPQYLDANLAETPDFAALGLYLETRRALEFSMTFARDRILDGPARAAAAARRSIRELMGEIRHFVDGMMSSEPMSGAPAKAVPELVRVLQHCEELLVLPPEPSDDEAGREHRKALMVGVLTCLTMPHDGEEDSDTVRAAQAAADEAYGTLKDLLLRQLHYGEASVDVVDRDLAWAQALKRISYVACRARLRLLNARNSADRSGALKA